MNHWGISVWSSLKIVMLLTTPSDYGSSCYDCIPRGRSVGFTLFWDISPLFPTTYLVQENTVCSALALSVESITCDSRNLECVGVCYRYEHWTVIGTTEFGDTVQENRWHFLVLVFDETEDLEREAPHLTLAILKHSCLWVFVTAVSASKRHTKN